MSEKLGKLRNLLLTEIPDYLIDQFKTNHCCVSASRIVADVLNAHGIECRPRTVTALLVNKRGEELREKFFAEMDEIYASETELTEEEENKRYLDFMETLRTDPEVWFVRMAVQLPDKVVDDHTVIEFADGSILDMTLDQASLPEKNLAATRFWGKRGDFLSSVLYYEFTDTPVRPSGAVGFPNFREVVDHVSRRVAETLAEVVE